MVGPRRRVLLVSHHLENRDSGAQRIYFQLLDSLQHLTGWEPELLHLEDFVDVSRARRTKLISRVALPRVISAGLAQRDLSGYAAVMSSSGMAAPLFASLSTRAERPLLVNHVHGLFRFDDLANRDEHHLDHWRTSRAYRTVTGPRQLAWDEAGIRTADVVITQNRRDLSEVRAQRGDDGTVMITPALYDRLEVLAREVRERPADAPTDRILWFGTWESRKGAYYVAPAFRAVREEFPQARLTIGATGRQADEVLAAFDPRDRAHVRVLARVSVEEHVRLMAEHDIFLFPSLSEGFGLAALEAAACGLAVVTTQTGLGADHLRDGVDARVVFPSSLHISGALRDLIRDPALTRRLGRAVRELAAGFTTKTMVAAYAEVFERSPRRQSGADRR